MTMSMACEWAAKGICVNFGIVVFLASGASDFISGAVIPVDGGAIASDGFPAVPAVK